MYTEFSTWLDLNLKKDIPKSIIALNFNIYEYPNDSYSIQLVGAKEFDEYDEDWVCDALEISDFWIIKNSIGWKVVLKDIKSLILKYLQIGLFANFLKDFNLAFGFVDGDLEIINIKK